MAEFLSLERVTQTVYALAHHPPMHPLRWENILSQRAEQPQLRNSWN